MPSDMPITVVIPTYDRAQLVCENCGGVVSLDLSVLQGTGGGS